MASSAPAAVPGEKSLHDVWDQSKSLAMTLWGLTTRRMKAMFGVVVFL